MSKVAGLAFINFFFMPPAFALIAFNLVIEIIESFALIVVALERSIFVMKYFCSNYAFYLISFSLFCPLSSFFVYLNINKNYIARSHFSPPYLRATYPMDLSLFSPWFSTLLSLSIFIFHLCNRSNLWIFVFLFLPPNISHKANVSQELPWLLYIKLREVIVVCVTLLIIILFSFWEIKLKMQRSSK